MNGCIEICSDPNDIPHDLWPLSGSRYCKIFKNQCKMFHLNSLCWLVTLHGQDISWFRAESTGSSWAATQWNKAALIKIRVQHAQWLPYYSWSERRAVARNPTQARRNALSPRRTHSHSRLHAGLRRHTIGYLSISVEAGRHDPLKCDPEPFQEQPLALIRWLYPEQHYFNSGEQKKSLLLSKFLLTCYL